MIKQISNKSRKRGQSSFDIEVKVFKNKTNHQFNLPVLKKNTSPEIIRDILNNKNVVGLKFKITDVILKDAMRNDVILKKNYKGAGRAVHLSQVKGGNKK